MLGSDLIGLCHQKDLIVSEYDVPEFDISKNNHLEEILKKHQIIVNCAAFTDVDGAESQSQLAHRINGYAVGELGHLADQYKAYVIHISTDFVFDGTLDRPYVETDEPNPISEYGKSKLSGEQLLQETGCKHCIVRIEWTYGHHGNNFIRKLIDWSKNKKELKVVDDQVGSPTATKEVSWVILELMNQKAEGIFHFAADNYVSRYEIAEFVFEHLNLDILLKRAKSSDFKSPAKRPNNSRFNCEKIKTILDRPIRTWQKPLREFLEEL